MKFEPLSNADIDRLIDILENANETELRDYFRKVYDATLVEGNKRITVEP